MGGDTKVYPSSGGLRLDNLFGTSDVQLIQQAVYRVHRIHSRATLLIKQYYVDQLLSGHDLVIDEALYAIAVSAIRSKNYVQRKTAKDTEKVATKKTLNEGLQQTWRTRFEPYVSTDDIGIDTGSLSLMLSASAKTYVTNLLTNVRMRYFKYVERTVSELLRRQVARVTGAASWQALSRASKTDWMKRIRRAISDIIYHRHDDAMKADGWMLRWVERYRSRFVPPLPARVKTIDFDLSSQKRPYAYLPYMMKMSRCMEALGIKMLSPLPLSTSFIPSFYRIDTASMQHLLMDQKRIAYFREWHRKHYLRPLFLSSKAGLASSTSRLLGVDTATAQEEAAFKDAQWRLIGKWQRKDLRSLMPPTPRAQRRHPQATDDGEWMFGHSILTDGYSAYLTITDGERGRKAFRPRGADKQKQQQSTKQKVSEFPELSSKTARDYAHLLDPSVKLLAADPGKVNLVCLVDGMRKDAKDSHVLRYTGVQRRHESGETAARRRGEAAKSTVKAKGFGFMASSGRYVASPTVQQVEASYLRGTNSKSCFPDVFGKYVHRRMTTEKPLEEFYRDARWRRERMSAKMKRRRSEQAFVQRIKEKFGSDGQKIVILYGNWGRRPNLKNQAPSPGVGLRRVIHRHIPTVTVAEWNTSSRCATCFGTVQEACRSRGLKRCPEAACRTRYWDRDVMGALNIRHAGLHILTHGVEHGEFRATG